MHRKTSGFLNKPSAATAKAGRACPAENTDSNDLPNRQLRAYLGNKLPWEKPLRILELNTGNGANAVYLANLGHEIIATGNSDSVLADCKNNIKNAGLESQIIVRQLDVRKLYNLVFTEKFDLIYLNTGVVNSLSPDAFKNLAHAIRNRLKTNGELIAVASYKMNWMDYLQLFMQDKAQAFSRKNNLLLFPEKQDGHAADKWSYPPYRIYNILKADFANIHIQPLGEGADNSPEKLFARKSFSQTIRMVRHLIQHRNQSPATDYLLINAY